MVRGQTDIAGLLSCNEMRYFWLSWENHRVTVGQGYIPGQKVILRSTRSPTSEIIMFVGVSTESNRAGQWQFRDIEGIFMLTFVSLSTLN